ncbi:MAG: DUF2934 domain-containing protein [Phycisphaerae bacterium]|nr:DUF2934 domain-containing protein [Phycisphaerae bacterium]
MAEKTNKTTPSKAKPRTTAKAKKAPRKSSKKVATPSYDVIAERAWSIWMDKGCQPGQDEQNWLEAVAQLESELVSC